MNEPFTSAGRLLWGIPAEGLSSLLPQGLDRPVLGDGEGGRGWSSQRRVLRAPSQMGAPAGGRCLGKQLPINNGSSTCQEVVRWGGGL